MVRPLRIEYPGAVYHITSRGNERKPIFKDDLDRYNFLQTIHHVNKRYNWLCHAYCLMDNHYHILIETLDGNLSIGMRQLNGVYTQTFNRRHKRTGHLFQGRYKAILIQKDSHLLAVCRYVVLNPVRARITESPDQWKWSSYLATAGKARAHPCLSTDWILDQLSCKRVEAMKRYRHFVESGIGTESIWGEVKAQSILGEEDFVNGLIDYVKQHREVPDIPRAQRYMSRPSLEKIFEGVLGDRRKRDRAIVAAVEEYGYTQREVADHIGMHFTSISRIVRAVM